MVAWNTKLVKIQDMAVAEMVIQLLKEETMKVVPKTHVRTHCLDAVMMEKQLLLELGKTSSLLSLPLMPYTAITYKFLPPVLSAQFMT